MRFDDEVDAGLLQLVRGSLPLRHREHRAEVAHRHVMAIDRAGLPVADFLGREVRDNLVAVEIEIDPRVGRAPLGTAEQAAVKGPRLGKVIHGESEMEQRLWRGGGVVQAVTGSSVADAVVSWNNEHTA